MRNAAHAAQASSLEQIEYLVSLLRGNAGFERQVDGYLEARNALADYFRELAGEELEVGGPSIGDIKKQITHTLETHLAGRVPVRLLEVRGYTGVHQVLLRYLHRHVGTYVRAARLRVLTGDQVHTERRVRELRDLGLAIEAKKVASENQYRLVAGEPNLIEAARFQLKKNLEKLDEYSPAAIAILQGEVG